MSVHVAVIVNRRQRREALAELLSGEVVVHGCGTVAQAEELLGRRRIDGLIIEGYAYPGVGCSDPALQLLAAELPNLVYSDRLAHWAVALQFLRVLREGDERNATIPVLVLLGDLPEQTFGVVDELTRSGVQEDLLGLQPAAALFGEGAKTDASIVAWCQHL